MYHYAGNNPVKYTDPDGRILANIVAATVGAAVGAAVGAYTTYKAGGDSNAIKAAAIGGAIGGATAGLTLGASVIAGAAIAAGTGAVVAAGADIALDLSDGKDISSESVLKAALGGSVGAVSGYATGHSLGKVVENRPRNVSIDKLKPNPDDEFNFSEGNYSHKVMQNARQEILQNGRKLKEPINVLSNGDGSYQVLNGSHHLEAAKQLGLKEVPINIME